MPLKINNTEITKLFIDGIEYKALYINNDGKFGKKFSLVQNTCTGATVSVIRGSSPYQKAVTGTLSSGSAIYFGDTLTFSVSCNSDYQNAELYIDIGDGNGMIKRTSPFTVSVNGDVKYYGVAQKVQEYYEKIFTGSREFTSSGSLNVPALKSTDTVKITAEVIFYDYVGKDEDAEYTGYIEESSEYITRNITEQKLPYKLQFGYAYVAFEHNGQNINFEFNDYYNEFKGIYIFHAPYKVIIKEVWRKI